MLILPQKAAERTGQRHEFPDLRGTEYDRMFEWHYQSSDDTDNGDTAGAIDPNSDNDPRDEPRVKTVSARNKALLSRAPTYRLEAVSPSSGFIDVI